MRAPRACRGRAEGQGSPESSRERPELIAGDLGAQPFDELRLSSLTLWRRDEDPCRRVGRGGAVVASDEVEAQIDAGRHAGGGEDVAVVDEQTVGQHLDQGVATL